LINTIDINLNFAEEKLKQKSTMTASLKSLYLQLSLENQFTTDKLNGELMQTVFNTEDWDIMIIKTILGLLRLVSKNR
jgi:hypothetical protein